MWWVSNFEIWPKLNNLAISINRTVVFFDACVSQLQILAIPQCCSALKFPPAGITSNSRPRHQDSLFIRVWGLFTRRRICSGGHCEEVILSILFRHQKISHASLLKKPYKRWCSRWECTPQIGHVYRCLFWKEAEINLDKILSFVLAPLFHSKEGGFYLYLICECFCLRQGNLRKKSRKKNCLPCYRGVESERSNKEKYGDK